MTGTIPDGGAEPTETRVLRLCSQRHSLEMWPLLENRVGTLSCLGAFKYFEGLFT